MMVGYQHLHPECLGACHAVKAGDAVVNRDQQIGIQRLDALCNRCSQSVAINHPVGYEVGDMASAQQLEAAQRDSTRCCTVAVVIGHDTNLFIRGNGVCQQHSSLRCAQQPSRRQQPRQAIIEFIRGTDPTRRIKLRQQRMKACLLQSPQAAGWYIAHLYFHS